MRPDPGDIPMSLGQVDLVAALSIARDLPYEALELAAERPQRITPAVLEVVTRAASGETLSERDANLLFWGIFVLGHARDLRLYRPLLALLRRPDEELAPLLGDDMLMEASARLVASVFDGDAAPLLDLLSDAKSDEGIRLTLFGALAYLTWKGRIPAVTTHAFLTRFDDLRPVRSGDAGWHGWENAIGLLGFHDLVPRVEAAHADARLLGVFAEPERCGELAAAAAASPDDEGSFEREGLGEVGHPLDEFEHLLGATAGGEEPEPDEPVRNPLREIGRNDPCPCGSGRKFKKCCLQAA